MVKRRQTHHPRGFGPAQLGPTSAGVRRAQLRWAELPWVAGLRLLAVRGYPSRRMFRKVLPITLLVVISCGRLKEPTAPDGGAGDPIDPTATFTRVQNEIFTPTCAQLGCHDPLGRQESMVLSPGRAYAQIVGVASIETPQLMRVAPGDAANSYLYRKITGAGSTGDRMPQNGPFLNAAQIKLVRDWIRRGAPND